MKYYAADKKRVTAVDGKVKLTNRLTKDPSHNPSTGDDSKLGLWLALMIISGGAFAALIIAKKKKDRRGESKK